MPRSFHQVRPSLRGPSGECFESPDPDIQHLSHISNSPQSANEASFVSALRNSLKTGVSSETKTPGSWASIPPLESISTGLDGVPAVLHPSGLRPCERTETTSSSARIDGNPLRAALGEFKAIRGAVVGAEVDADLSIPTSSSTDTQHGLFKSFASQYTGEEPSQFLNSASKQPCVSLDQAIVADERPGKATSDWVTAAASFFPSGTMAISTCIDPVAQPRSVIPVHKEPTREESISPLLGHPWSSANFGQSYFEAQAAGSVSLQTSASPSSSLSGVFPPLSELGENLSGQSDNYKYNSDFSIAQTSLEYPASKWGQTSGIPANLSRNEGNSSAGSRGTPPDIDLTKTNELLQQLLDGARRARQPFLPLQGKALLD